MIKCVALRFRGVIYSLPVPNRHHDVIRHIVKTVGVSHVDVHGNDQGFLDTDSRYLTRVEALVVATENNQLIRKTHPSHLLFSEDMW